MIMRRLRTIHIAPSAYFAKKVAIALELQVSDIHISPSGGIDDGTNLPLDNHYSNQIYRIGFAGHLNETKGFPAVCDIVNRITELETGLARAIEFHLIRHKQDHGACLPSTVIWHDPYPTDQMETFFCHIDVLISPSQSESLGLTALEAVANDCPVIAPDRFAFGEFIRHEVNGLLYDPDIRDALFQSILQAANKGFSFPTDELYNYRAGSIERFYAAL